MTKRSAMVVSSDTFRTRMSSAFLSPAASTTTSAMALGEMSVIGTGRAPRCSAVLRPGQGSAATCRARDGGEAADPRGLAPSFEIGICVAAEDQEKLALSAQRFERVDREGRSLPIQLDARYAKARFARGRGGQHREAILGTGDRPILLQRRAARRNEVDARESELVERRVRDSEMPDVHRIERAAENANAAHSSCPPSLHSISSPPIRTVSPSLAPSARSSRSIPVRISWRWK